MKHIHILYHTISDPGQRQLAEQYSAVLRDAGYTTELFCLNSVDETIKYMPKPKTGNCQMVISLNLAGFHLMTTGNCSSMNHLTVNIVNLIDCSPKMFSFNLKQRMNYTMSFILSSEEDANYMKENFPHIRNVYWSSSFAEFLPAYLEELDWRY